MTRLEDLTPGAVVSGILPKSSVTVVAAEWHGTHAVSLTYRTPAGDVSEEVLFRSREPELSVLEEGLPWSFDGDSETFKLVSEARRISLAYLFDPLLAVHTSLIEPLPHQITAVYEHMLPRQPLKYLLADDPGAGKTVMAGLLIKELMIRGDVQRCMVVCPGALAEQWQDELDRKFQIPFEIMTNDKLESARSGNWLQENDLVICRLDKLARSEEDLHPKLQQTDWDLIICDEAHKMSASYFGSDVKYTKRYRLGQLLSGITRHFLLMTATPHNGKEEDFQLFLALLDADRFEGKARTDHKGTDPSDLMRRLVKEDLLKFDGCPLFPERRAYTVTYQLSEEEDQLYQEVTNYVRNEFNRVEALQNDGRRGTVGFALTILQRRLASSPEAIYQSLRRRRERLQERLGEARIAHRSASSTLNFDVGLPDLSDEERIEDFEDSPGDELEAMEEEVLDQATAAQTVEELQAEIQILENLEKLARAVRQSQRDRKWEELSRTLQENPLMKDEHGNLRKLVIFTEHRDTLNYLVERLGSLLGSPDRVVTIHGALRRDVRRQAEHSFKQDADVQILVATDAAGEGINLQRAHLMVNYDLPWNPNRLEQRFGRIHRIGQTEVCHLWNLVAEETREGAVFQRLLEKLDVERQALGGAVFDVLGRVFQGQELRNLLIQAIREGERPEVRARLHQVLDSKLDRGKLLELLEDKGLVMGSMNASRVQEIRQEMERANVRRLQPHFIASFFHTAFERLGGKLAEREPQRYQIRHVPSAIRNRDHVTSSRDRILKSYERVAFDKDLLTQDGRPAADFLCPGHPLFDATVELVLERHQDLLRQGSILLDPTDPGEAPRVLFYLEHSIQDGSTTRLGGRRVVSRQLQFVEIDAEGSARRAGHAPYLDYRPLTESERAAITDVFDEPWLREGLESRAKGYAIEHLVPDHLDSVKRRKTHLVEKTRRAVHARLTREIQYWDRRYQDIREKEEAGKTPKLNSRRAGERRDALAARLERRMQDLDAEARLSPLPPVVAGGALVIPAGLLARLSDKPSLVDELGTKETKEVELRAMRAVMEAERALGHTPRDVSAENRGWDVESLVPTTASLRFLEVKGRTAGGKTVCITRNEILQAKNEAERFLLALVRVDGETTDVRYLQGVFDRPDFQWPEDPGFPGCGAFFDFEKLWDLGAPPA